MRHRNKVTDRRAPAIGEVELGQVYTIFGIPYMVASAGGEGMVILVNLASGTRLGDPRTRRDATTRVRDDNGVLVENVEIVLR